MLYPIGIYFRDDRGIVIRTFQNSYNFFMISSIVSVLMIKSTFLCFTVKVKFESTQVEVVWHPGLLDLCQVESLEINLRVTLSWRTLRIDSELVIADS